MLAEPSPCWTSGGAHPTANIVTEDMRVEHASIIKSWLLDSIASLTEQMTEQCPPSMKETISMVEDVLVQMRIAPQPGPAMIVTMVDDTLEVHWLSGTRVCESMPLSNAPLWTNPMDVLQFKAFAHTVLARAPSTFTTTSDIQGCEFEVVELRAKHVYDDSGVQLEDTDDVSCLTRLTVGTTHANYAARDAAFIEHSLRGAEFNHHAISQTQAFQECQRGARDLVALVAWDCDRVLEDGDCRLSIFADNVEVVYGQLGGLDKWERACLLRAYQRWWPNEPRRREGPSTRLRPEQFK